MYSITEGILVAQGCLHDVPLDFSKGLLDSLGRPAVRMTLNSIGSTM